MNLFTVLAIFYLIGEVLCVIMLFSSKVDMNDLTTVYIFASLQSIMYLYLGCYIRNRLTDSANIKRDKRTNKDQIVYLNEDNQFRLRGHMSIEDRDTA